MTYSLNELQQLSIVLSNLSSVIIAAVSIYASLSYRRWRREEIERRRATLAQSCMDHMQRFISKMERLVETRKNVKSSEWGKAFYEAYDQYFKSAEIEADTLAHKNLIHIFEQINQLLKELPLSSTIAEPHFEAQDKGQDQDEKTEISLWENAAKETQDKINNVWERVQSQWKELKQILEKEALIV